MQDLWGALLQNLVFMVVFLPLVGAGLVLASARFGGEVVRRSALANVLLTCALSALMVAQYDPHRQDDVGRPQTVQMVSDLRWTAEWRFDAAAQQARLHGPDVRIAVGVDGLSLWPVALVSVLMLSAVLVGGARDRPEWFYALLLVLQSAVAGTFAALDVVLFVVCLEVSLLLTFLLIGRWGGAARRPAARRFLLVNLAGSLLIVSGLVGLVVARGWMLALATQSARLPALTFRIPELIDGTGRVPGIVSLADYRAETGLYWAEVRPWILLALGIGFAVKQPLVPFHRWLTGAAAEAPTAAMLLLCGAMLPLGTYGWLRFVVPLFPDGIAAGGAAAQTLLVLGAVYAGLLCLAQSDIRRLAVLAAVSQLMLGTAGLLSQNLTGVTGGVLLSLSLALTTPALILCARGGRVRAPAMALPDASTRLVPGLRKASDPATRRVSDDLSSRGTTGLVVAALAMAGAPGLSGFVGQILTLLGILQGHAPPPDGGHPAAAFWGLVAVLLVWWSLLRWIDGARHGERMPLDPVPLGGASPDGSVRATAALLPMGIAILALGLWPRFFTDRMEPTLARIIGHAAAADAETANGDRRSSSPLDLPARRITPVSAHRDNESGTRRRPL